MRGQRDRVGRALGQYAISERVEVRRIESTVYAIATRLGDFIGEFASSSGKRGGEYFI